MRTITRIFPHRDSPPVALKGISTLTLPFLERSKSRQRVFLSNGEEVILNLPRGGVMRGGDILVADDGHYIRVQAAPEKILRVQAEHNFDLMRAAYHLGNRHIPVEVGADYLHLEYDPVLADMLTQLGVTISMEERPFEPEHGAYGGGHKHGHDESFAEDYALAQSAYKAHSHDHHHSHDHTHTHDDDCEHHHE